MTINERIHKEVAREVGVRIQDVDKIVKSMFDMLTDAMEESDLRPIRMQYLGIWECKPLRVEKLKEKGYFK
jgi:nucleoid DNA-binding protein